MDNQGHPDKIVLLEEYRQLMESQRDNTRIAYSWISNIFLVLSSVLFIYGLSVHAIGQFVPAMILGIILAWIWVFLTEVFAGHIRQRFERIREISAQLGIAIFKKPSSKFRVAKTYVILFSTFYTIVWFIRLGFILWW